MSLSKHCREKEKRRKKRIEVVKLIGRGKPEKWEYLCQRKKFQGEENEKVEVWMLEPYVKMRRDKSKKIEDIRSYELQGA